MASALNIQFPGNLAQVDTANELRRVPSSFVTDGALYLVTDLGGIYEFDASSNAVDDGGEVIRPFDRTALQAGRWVKNADGLARGPGGPTGPADNTYTTYAALLASPPSRKSARLVPQIGETEPAGNFSYIGGAWVRQGADGVNFDGRSVNAKLFETVSITDARFAGGARVDRADNTAAIQAAIDYVTGRGGGTVLVPAGQYKHAGAIYMRANVCLQGQGDGAQLLSTNTTRLDGIIAFGPNTNSRMPGVSIDNIRLTSTFVGGSLQTSGNGINAKWLVGAKFTRVRTDYWSDQGIALTDCTNCITSDVEIDNVGQGYSCFNDSENCVLTNAVITNVFTYVPLNIEGLANGSTFRPRDFIGSNISINGFITHGINLVNAIRPVIMGWSVQGGTGNLEGPGNGIEAYGCDKTVIGPGIAYNNAGYGVIVGPTQNDTMLSGIITVGNTMGGLLATDGGGVGTALRISDAGCRFLDGVKTAGNVTFLNVSQEQTIEAALPMLRMSATAPGKRNAQTIYSSAMDADQMRVGVDVSTNNGTKIFQAFLDSYGDQVFGADPVSLTGGIDNLQSLGRPDRRFSVVYSGTSAINTSDERTKNSISAIPDDWLDAWGDVDWCRFKFNDGIRWHAGVIAQQVRDVFASRGLDATDIGLLCHDEWDAEPAREAVMDAEGAVSVPAYAGRPAGDLWSVRMSECQAMEAAWQRREIARLKAAMA